MSFVRHVYEGKRSRYYIDGKRLSQSDYEAAKTQCLWARGRFDSFWTRAARDGHLIHGFSGSRSGK